MLRKGTIPSTIDQTPRQVGSQQWADVSLSNKVVQIIVFVLKLFEIFYWIIC